MRTGRRGACVALGVAAALLAASCGSSDDSDEAAPTTEKGAATTAAAGGTTANSFGPDPKNPKVILGPEGYKIDTAKCAAGWKDNEGTTDTEIRIAQSWVFTGNVASAGPQSLAMKALMEHVNATEGGVAGKKIVFTSKDDGYEAARTKANVDELLETVKPLAFAAIDATPGNLAVYDKLNESCVPHLLAATGHPAMSDPVNHPWTTGSFLAYEIEGSILAEYAATQLGKGGTVAGMFINNDAGIAYRKGFEKKAKEAGLNLVKAETFEAAAATVTNEVTTLASTNADAFFIATIGATCTQGIKSLSETSWKPKLKLIASVCVANTLSVAGPAAADFVEAGYRKTTETAEAMRTDPDAIKMKEILEKGGVDASDPNSHSGFIYGYPLVQILKNAAKLPGGLTRTNVMLAAQSLDFDHPSYLSINGKKIKFQLNGLKDVAYTEGAAMQRWVIDPATGAGVWKPFGEIIEQNGQSVACAWDGKACK
ncbi:MAG: ABC transporter substrate-binding protein [Acidimicrobiales bacterium]